MKKKLLVILPYIAIITLLILLFSYKFEVNESGYVKYDTLENGGNKVATETIDNSNVITQDYKVEKDSFKYLKIHFNKEATNTDGKYLIELISKSGDIAFSKDVDVLEIVAAEGVYKAKLKNVVSGDYTLKLTYSGDKTECVPLINEIFKDNTYEVNGHAKVGLIQTEALYVNKISNIIFYSLTAVFIIICSIILYVVIYKKKDVALEKKFLYIAIPIFLLYMIFVPLYVAHDELFHWYRVFEISEGGFLPKIQDNTSGYNVPVAVSSGLPWGKLRYIDIIREGLFDKLDYNNMTFLSDVTTSVYSPIQYLPHVIGVAIAKNIVKSPILLSYYGRLFNLIVSIALLYWAIKKIPFGKHLVFITSFIPIAVEGFISLSADGFTLSVAMLFIAYVLEIYHTKRKVDVKDFLILGALGVIIAFCKIVYIPITFLLILIPKESFGTNKKKYLTIIPIIIFFIFCNLLWLALAKPYLEVYTNGKSTYQVMYVLMNPIRYVQNFLCTVQTNGLGYIMEMFGENMLWGNAVKNSTFVPILLIILVAYLYQNDELKKKFDIKSIILITFIILCVIALMFTSLYVQWTTYTSNTISGIQGRYFLPISILIFLLLGNFIGKEEKKHNNFDTLVVISSVFASFMCLMEMIVKYI